MQWVPFIILAWLAVLMQASVGKVLTFSGGSIGAVGPDLAAIVATFFALNVRGWADVMLAAFVLGLGLDLSAGGGAGFASAVGPMPVAYALAAGMVYRIREAFFREHWLTQAMLAAIFCVVAHGLWITWQALLAYRTATWAAYVRMWLQVLSLAGYTAVLMPLGHLALARCQRWFISQAEGRHRRR